MNARINLPLDWKKIAAFVIAEHMRAPQMTRHGKIVDFLMKLHKSQISVKDFNDIINLDNHGLPSYLANAEKIIAELLKINGKNAPAELKGAEIGDWIRAERIKIFSSLN